MSTAVAVHPPSHSSPLRPRDSETRSHNSTSNSSPRPAPPASKPSSEMRRSLSSNASARAAGNNASRSPSDPDLQRNTNGHPRASRSPQNPSQKFGPAPQTLSSPNGHNVPIIKKEAPSSPESTHIASHPLAMSASRHRPRKLDLSSNKNVPRGASTVGARPSASKDSGGLSAMQDVATACLSPGFQTHDPSMQQQLARSMEMREQQRQIIEARLHGKPPPEKGPGMTDAGPPTSDFGKPPNTSRRKGPPPGLSINAPSAHQFASEPRVIQSAPLNQTFTGLHPKSSQNSLSRQVLDRHPRHPGPVNGPPLAQATASQTSNRLPPISDVFASENLGSARDRGAQSGFHAPHSTYSPAHAGASLPSPGYPPPPASAGLQPPRAHHGPSDGSAPPSRSREFRSAEEAVHTLSGGREELLPKVVHYGGHQPPTPPSPHHQGHHQASAAGSSQAAPHSNPRSSSHGKRRTREEYERDYPEQERMEVDPRDRERGERRFFGWEEERGRRAAPGTWGYPGRDSPETNRRKKEEFMALCARAWDLFHS